MRPVDLSDLAHAQVKPVRYVVQTLIPCAHLTLLGSHGGSGKTNLALTVAAHVAVGAPWAGFETEHRPVLFASLEDGGDIVRLRLRRICAAYGLDPAAVGRNIRLLDGSGSLSALMAETGAYSGRKIEETPTLIELRAAVGDAGLIVIDNASDAVDFNESDRRAVRVFVRTLAGLGHRNEAGVLLLAHIDKNAARYGSAGNSYSGSTGWHNSARSRLALLADRDGVQLVQEKANLGAKAEPVRLRWTDSGVLVPDDSGDGAEHASNADAVMAAIAAAIADGVTVSTGRTGPATTQKLLENFPDLPTHLRGPRGREAFWAAITDLQRAGKITAEDFQNSARKLRQRFVIAAAPIAPIAPVPTIGAIDQ
ncbi:AAA family ATPase [Rhodanobacter sp. LX-100]|nr:AAA family ATPase [Rhodanobacter sp. LX-99]MBT2149329.1 AAA family ATPase [Rhodanobacter sp. LX-100]